MVGGVLVASRANELFPFYQEQLKERRFMDVTVTDADKDGLSMLIRDLNPRLLMLGCDFYDCCTSFMMSRLLRQHPGLNIAVVSIGRYPVDLEMSFIINGVTSYLRLYDGIKEYHNGLDRIRVGEKYVSPKVEERMETCPNWPRPSEELTDVQIEVVRLLSHGYTNLEVANTLAISERTVVFHKEEIFKSLFVRNDKELIRVARYLKITNDDDLNFYGGNYELRQRAGKERKTKNGGKNADKN